MTVPSWHALRVAQVTPLTEEAVAIELELPAELREAFRFRAGQHLTIARGEGAQEVRRSYSICVPAGADALRVAVKRVPGGALSSYLTSDLRTGDVLRVMTPTGSFGPQLDPSRRRHYGLIAAGSGITPLISILASALACEPQSTVTLVYGNRTRASTMFLDELDTLRAQHGARLRVHHMRSREPIADPICRGRLDAARLDALMSRSLPPASVDAWFVCGPQGMVEQARAALRARGVPAERVHSELFHADASAVATQEPDRPRIDSEVTVELGERRVTFALASDGDSVLAAALPLLPEIPYGCRDGMCATCRAKVLDGEVTMERCTALGADEVRDGYVLACQAHPASERVVLTFGG